MKPNYGGLRGEDLVLFDRWNHLISDVLDKKSETPIKVNQDVNLFVIKISGTADGGECKAATESSSYDFGLGENRQGYLLCIEGSVTVTSKGGMTVDMVQHDACELYGKLDLSFNVTTKEGAHLLIYEMLNDGRGGRSDA